MDTIYEDRPSLGSDDGDDQSLEYFEAAYNTNPRANRQGINRGK